MVRADGAEVIRAFCEALIYQPIVAGNVDTPKGNIRRTKFVIV